MSKKEKLLQKIRQNPKNVRFEELDILLSWYGFKRRQAKKGTSHYVYTLTTRHQSYRLTVPFKRPFIKRVYVQHALETLDELKVDEADSDKDELEGEGTER